MNTVIIIDHTLGNFGKPRINTRFSFGGFNPFIEKLNKKIKKGHIKKKKPTKKKSTKIKNPKRNSNPRKKP
jgi:hypothetical protein